MTNRQFAGLIGAMYLCLGLVGIWYMSSADALHQALHFAVGLWGVISAISRSASVRFARKTTLLFAAVVVLELSPMLRDAFGALLVAGNGLPVIHSVTALATAYYGYYWTDAVTDAETPKPKKAA